MKRLSLILSLMSMPCYADQSAAEAGIEAVMEASGFNDAVDAVCDAVGLGDDE